MDFTVLDDDVAEVDAALECDVLVLGDVRLPLGDVFLDRGSALDRSDALTNSISIPSLMSLGVRPRYEPPWGSSNS